MLCQKCLGFLQKATIYSHRPPVRDVVNVTSDVSLSFGSSPWQLMPRRHATAWKRRLIKQEKIKDVVFQYASDNTKKADRVYVWGYAGTGALGVRRFMKPEKNQMARVKQMTPHKMDHLQKNNIITKKVGCGYGSSVLLCQSGSQHLVYGCGINTDSQLGYQEYPKKSGRILDFVVEPAPVDLPLLAPKSTRLIDVACGRAHTLIVSDKEGVFSLGNNAHGQCGRPVVPGEIHRGSQIINKVRIAENVVKVYCGQDHSLFLTENGSVYSCGLGADGQTGLGHFNAVDKPQKVKGDIEGEKIVSLATKADCVLAVSESGDLFGWGNSEYDQLSVVSGDHTQVNTARHLTFTNIGKVTKAAAAGSMCAVLNDQGQVYVWGFGILGQGPKLDQSSTPRLIPHTLFGYNEFNPNQRVVDIQAGISHFAALTESGELYMWGRNKLACLGIGNDKDQFFPFKVQVPADVKHVSCGVDHTFVLCKTFT